MSDVAVNSYVFLLAFSAAFLLGTRRPLLTLSTRALLLVLLALALGYGLSEDAWYRAYLGVAALVANGLFIAFAAIDFYGWRRNQIPPT